MNLSSGDNPKFLCYKNTENLYLTIQNLTIGFRKDSMASKFTDGDVLLIYCRGHIWGTLTASGEMFQSQERVWKNGHYPFRLKIEKVKLFEEPINITDTDLSHKQ